MILGKTDKISNAGFFSDFELSKITPGYNPSYTVHTNLNLNQNEDEEELPAYLRHETYSRDFTAADAGSMDVDYNYARQHGNEWYVGKDGNIYLKSSPGVAANTYG